MGGEIVGFLILFVFVFILAVICFTALLSIIEETSDDKQGKKLYKKNERVKKDL